MWRTFERRTWNWSGRPSIWYPHLQPPGNFSHLLVHHCQQLQLHGSFLICLSGCILAPFTQRSHNALAAFLGLPGTQRFFTTEASNHTNTHIQTLLARCKLQGVTSPSEPMAIYTNARTHTDERAFRNSSGLVSKDTLTYSRPITGQPATAAPTWLLKTMILDIMLESWKEMWRDMYHISATLCVVTSGLNAEQQCPWLYLWRNSLNRQGEYRMQHAQSLQNTDEIQSLSQHRISSNQNLHKC